MVAGEVSGDLLSGLLLGGLKARWPDLTSMGIGGPHMERLGFQAWWSFQKLAVHGFNWELLRRYREIVGIRDQMRKRLLKERPDIFIGTDAPDFNFKLEEDLRAAGIKTVHFVCPSVWAWRPERMEKIRRSADHVLCIFPFEPELLARHGIAATYVGHPLANVIPMEPDRAAARLALGLDATAPLVAILPGSRRSEISHLAERFIRAAALIRAAQPTTRFVLPVVPGFRAVIESLVQQCGLQDSVTILDGQSHAALAACDVTLIASGTATLEAALYKRPMVIAYHQNWLSWQIMRRKRLQPWVGLPNILCAEFVVPELLQDAATPQALADATLAWLDAPSQDPQRLQALQTQFVALHHSLQRDTATIATDAIQKVLQS
ncbi:lipid-A-disaccharide synthase [Rhodoferax lacus]|uniref:Lipid-A-disaccharide synthase n=2 Tax=Rhodoferax lacus TaxID=2184758 RepID=A0A3E1RCJ3_9BURK|nr:lipid-A-disaccharide synthase [Rhodoferax lacus]